MQSVIKNSESGYEGNNAVCPVIYPAGEQDASCWDRFVEINARACTYHRYGWRRVIEQQFGHETYYWIARTDNDVVGVLPTVRLRSRLFGDFLVSLPYFTYGGAVATSGLVEQSLMTHACEQALSMGVSHVEFRDLQSREGWTNVRTDKVSMWLPLPSSVDEMWSSLKSERRNRIKKPQKEGATTVAGGLELLDDFYSVFTRNMRDLGTPVYGRDFFEAMIREFPNDIVMLSTRYQGNPVAAALLMKHKTSMEIPWVSSVRDFNHLSFNILLYWECLKTAIEAGKSTFDFGRSSVGSGTYTFKERWGAKPEQLYWHYWLGPGQKMPNLTPKNPKFQLAVKMWQKLPLPVANRLGPHIVRNLP